MDSTIWQAIRPLDLDALRSTFRAAQPFPFVAIDGFLRPEFADELNRTYPSVAEAERTGHTFDAVNERGKTQVTAAEGFPDPVRRLNEVLAHPDWLAALSHVTGIPELLADEKLVGGGMHVMRSGALLDVHVDFNLLPDRPLHRRLNILVFMNQGWQSAWGGGLELWDAAVEHRAHRFLPELNRCVIFETSQRSFHGVEPVTCPPDRARRSFAAYYYTREAPAGWDGRRHSTVFRARPDERFKGSVLMPLAQIGKNLRRAARSALRGGRDRGTGQR